MEEVHVLGGGGVVVTHGENLKMIRNSCKIEMIMIIIM